MPDAPLLDEAHIRLRRTRHGPMLYNVNDTYIGRSLDRYGEYVEAELALIGQLVRPGSVVVDAGANIGTHTVFLAKAVGPQGAVFSFEPQRLVFQMLAANIALNALTNVRAYWAAAGREPGTIIAPIADPTAEQNFGGMELGGFATGDLVPVMTIDSFNLPVCHLIKIDVEGMELDVVEGAAATIARYRPVLFVENDRDSPRLIERLFSMDYRLYWHTAPMVHDDNYFGLLENIFGEPVFTVNMIGVPRESRRKINGLIEVDSVDDTWEKFFARVEV
ncbi:MAG: FkbM family methyltransferase [Alphaproteobacteria bacterium]